jgi:hypothetical protein
MASADVIDLSVEEKSPSEVRALSDLKKNLSHFLISKDKVGPEIEFGDVTLKFRSAVPASAMVLLLGEDNRIDGLRGYIRETLVPESREDFEGLLESIPLEALNAIVEFLAEAATPFPTT